MIRIIKKGTRTFNTCNKCGCEYTYEKEDILIEEAAYHGGGDCYYVACPQCNTRNYISQVKNFKLSGVNV